MKNSLLFFGLFFIINTAAFTQIADMKVEMTLTEIIYPAEVVSFDGNNLKVQVVCEKSYQPSAEMPAKITIHTGVKPKKGPIKNLHHDVDAIIASVEVAESGLAVTILLKLDGKDKILSNYLKTENSLFVSWKKDLLLEHETLTAEDGKTIIDMYYSDGYPTGRSEQYTEDDSVTVISHSILGQYHGPYEIYNNGTLFKRMNYFYGELSGPEIWYHPNGNIRYEGESIDGRKEGPAKNYYPDGTLHTVGYFENDSLEGEYISYHPNGKKKVHGYKHRGEYTGTCTSYYENGNIHFQQEKINGVNTGDYFRNYESGAREVDANWLNDLLHGERIDYYENGEKKMQGSYKAGKQVGEWTYWDESGVKRTEKF